MNVGMLELTPCFLTFEKVVRYGPQHRNFANDNGTVDNSNGAEGLIEASGAEKDKTLSWLNAYNAPHWMQLFASTNMDKPRFLTENKQLPGWDSSQLGTYDKKQGRIQNVEVYGTSWMYDLMAAKQFAPDSLRQASSQFNGATDANYGVTPKWNGGIHSTHDLGMAFDLGVSGYIDRDGAQKRHLESLLTSINDLPGNGWSLADAVAYTNHILNSANNTVGLPNIVGTPTTSGNDQVSAIRDFLSLYALTQADGQAGLNGHVFNTTAQSLFGGMITQVHIGSAKKDGSLIAGQNPYKNINKILEKLHITSSPVSGHQNHFHIYLKPPTALGIGPANLLADAATASAPGSSSPATLQAETQGLQDFTQTLIEGEELMFIMDVPVMPAQDTPIVLVQAATPVAGATPPPDYILNTCTEKPSTGNLRSAERALDPAGMLQVYIEGRDNRVVELSEIKNVTILQDTKVGKITSVVDNTGRSWYRYDAPANYEGNDKAIFMAEYQGKRYKIVVEIVVLIVIDQNSSQCDPPKLIKVTKPSSGSSGYDINSINVTFSDLAGGALGQTTGTNITLDDNAAGLDWFIDTTPGDNSEFLPTSNPYEWVAKEGSAAYGKMDMLSVLLHEYGHALGIEHSADGHDYMATTLTAGVRRMPSAEELALMQQLVGEVKTTLSPSPLPSGGEGQNGPSQLPLLPLGGFGLAFLGRLRSTRYGSLNVEADLSTLVTQFDVSANAKLTNGNFSVASGMPVDNGWATQGRVDFVPATGSGQSGSATLKEISTSQTRLNQVFVVNPRDRFLSFTIAGSVLDDVNGAPDDAFEVALLDANTGLSLAGALSLTRTDAMLNIQANGTETAASGVTRVTNGDGSRTYRVDLAGIAVGTAVNLSFDLIGFGKSTSEVTIRDVRVSGLPELHDDAATMNEDGTLAFDPFAQVDNATLLQLGSHVVDQPAHGTVTVNPDGTFAYTPAADYFGSDSFTYRLNDGPLESNLATVTVSIAAVNDAPVAGDVYATLAEDTPLVINLGQAQGLAPTGYVTDVDSAMLTIQIVAGPSHGVLLANADGSYTYTAEANYNGADSFTYQANDGQLGSNVASVNLNIISVNDAPVANDVAVYTLEDNQLVLNLLGSASDIDNLVFS